MRGLIALWNEERALRAEARDAFEPDVLSCFIDMGYFHYALGDTLTKLIYIACDMHDNGLAAADMHILVNPLRPAAPSQGFITPENYTSHLANLLPAFTCLPGLRALHILRDGDKSAAYRRLLAHYAGVPIWPRFEDQVRQRVTYPLDHHAINAFHARNGFVPSLAAPRGYASWAHRFKAKMIGDRKMVCINPRQSRLTANATVTQRDADLKEWYDFIEAVGKRWPDIVFVQVGGYPEWGHRLQRYEHVLIPRAMGLSLAHELALMSMADMFMGTSSGFATWATFSHMPYLICNIEHFFADFAGVTVGAAHFPFADSSQNLLWTRESADLLMHYFCENMFGGSARAGGAERRRGEAEC
jgi:hypothetical protein